MATTSSPPSPLYDPARRDMFVHVAHQQSYYLPDSYHPADARQSSSSYFYPAADASSANSLHQGTHDANAVRLSQSQVCASPQYYGDASPGVIPYAAEYISHSGDTWLQEKQQPHHHADSTQAYTLVSHIPPFFDSGEVSPTSESGSSGTYGSPHHSDDGPLVDDRCCGDVHGHPLTLTAFSGYDHAVAPYPSPSVITAERYSHLAGPEGDLQPQASPTYYDEPAPIVFQPTPQHSGGTHLPFANDFAGSAEEVDALHHPQKYLERPPSGDNHPSPARYGAVLVEPQRGARTSPQAYPPQQQRTQSPMAHLPYTDVESYQHDPHPPRFYIQQSAAAFAYGEQQAMCPQPQYHHPGVHTAFPEPIAIPAPRSPPLVEDTPKKPLTLACFFCRKRKIACGSPSPGRKDRTCNQCARRNLRCEYPVNSRRGTRQREAEPALYPGSAGYGRVSS